MLRLDRSSQREIIAIAAFTLLGAGLRLWGFGTLGLTHFDEGIYALAGLWSLVPGGLSALDPAAIAYAPPGLPIAIGAAYLVCGLSDTAAILAPALCGVATVPAAGWLGRRTLGPGAGAAAAAMAALSMPHVAFSRKALTDVPFLLCWLVAIGLGGKLLERPTALRAVGFGIAVGLAQNVKYNGWLAGLVIAVAAAIGLMNDARRGSARGREALRLVGLVALAAAVAFATYWPWFQFVDNHGGYASLVRHHQSYVGGVRSWPNYWNQQIGQAVALSGGRLLGASACVLAALACVWTTGAQATPRRSPWETLRARVLPIAGLAGIAAALPSFAWWLGIAAVPWLMRDHRPGTRVLAVWWTVLSVMTPIYHPYARLWLPLHAAGWLLVAALAVRLVVLEKPPEPRASRNGMLALAAVVALGLAHHAWSAARCFPVADFFRPTTALRDMVQALPQLAPAGSPPPPLLVLGRRPLAFYLAVQGRYPFRLLAGPDDLPAALRAKSWVIVDEVLLDAASRAALARSGGVHPFAEVLDPVTLLDVVPAAAFGDLRGRTVTIWVVDERGRPR